MDISHIVSGPFRSIDLLPGLILETKRSSAASVVRKLRITIRRAETALSILSEHKDRKKLLKQMARMRKAAGHVRDVDVHLEILDGLGRRSIAGDFTKLKSHLKQRRLMREQKLTETLEKQIDGGVLERLEQFSVLEMSEADASEAISVRKIALEFITKATPTPKEAALHRFRLSCKHLRYSAELASESHEREVLLGELKKAQDAIGAWHDAKTLGTTAEELIGVKAPLASQLRAIAASRLKEAFAVIPKTLQSVRRLNRSGKRRTEIAASSIS